MGKLVTWHHRSARAACSRLVRAAFDVLRSRGEVCRPLTPFSSSGWLPWGLAPDTHFVHCGQERQVLVLLGRNDSGKTTLLDVISGSIKPTTVKIRGMSTEKSLSACRTMIGYCRASTDFFHDLTVEDHYWFFYLLKRGCSGFWCEEAVELMAQLEIGKLSGRVERILSHDYISHWSMEYPWVVGGVVIENSSSEYNSLLLYMASVVLTCSFADLLVNERVTRFRHQIMGFCPQADILPSYLTCRQILVFMAAINGYRYPQKKADESLREMNMTSKADVLFSKCRLVI
ncbi:unnamed protein product [Heligmosomoides polygyrus]|uniref:ABC transporter domain-containing protein n=1 Tax=Heligmosomoides polygyrus TaxID=6339 RepID=A0A3P8ECA4_HELPZ|nr:unnamed protein product [Heligmosomoides polygyrus]